MCCGCPAGFAFDDNWNCVEESECKCLDPVTNKKYPVRQLFNGIESYSTFKFQAKTFTELKRIYFVALH